MANSSTDIPRSGDSPQDGNRYSSPVQRLFPAFPPGWPGVGLLLLRAAAGVSLAVQGVACFTQGTQGPLLWLFGLLAAGAGALLLIGYLTPLAGSFAALFSAGVALSLLPRSIPNVLGGLPATVFVALMSAVVVLLGPGAFSLDARLFGRREVVIPPAPGPPRED